MPRTFKTPQEALRYHVSGAVERGEGEAITEVTARNYYRCSAPIAPAVRSLIIAADSSLTARKEFAALHTAMEIVDVRSERLEMTVRPGELSIGDRVEISPACDLWMRGARFGEVRRFIRSPYGAENDLIVVRMDHSQVKKLQRLPYDLLQRRI